MKDEERGKWVNQSHPSSLIPHPSICVVFALNRESQPFCGDHRHLRTVADAPCWAAVSGPTDSPLLVLVTGVGRARTEHALDWLLNQPIIGSSLYQPKVVFGAGFCGALQAGMRTGDLVFVSEVVDSDGEASWPLGVPRCIAPSSQPSHEGRMVTVPRLAAMPDEKRALALRWNAIAVDMESAEIARLCHEANIPLACIRVVVDELTDTLSPRLTSLLSAGRVSPVRLAATMATAPGIVPELWSLAKRTRFAARQLGTALTQALTLPLPWQGD